MKQRKLIFVFLAGVICCAALAQDRHPVTGRVLDAQGAAIENALVLVHWDNAGSTVGLSSNTGIKRDVSARTDKDGRFKFDLPLGFYDLFVSSPAFTPVAMKIKVRGGVASPIEIKLRVDPQVTKELGSRVVPD